MGPSELVPVVSAKDHLRQAAGSTAGKFVTGILIGGAVLGGAEGIRAYRAVEEYIPRATEATQVDLGKAEVQTLETHVDKKTFVGYTAKVEKSRVGVQTRLQVKKFNLDIPVGISSARTFSGTIQAGICQDAFDQKLTYDPNSKLVTVEIPKEAISICTKTDLSDRLITPENGLLNVPSENAASLLRGLKSAHIDLIDLPVIKQAIAGQNKYNSTLENYAEEQAHEQVAKQCGPKVWPLLKTYYVDGVTRDALQYLKLINPDLTNDNVIVKLGDTTADTLHQIDFKTDLEPLIEKIKKLPTAFDLSAEKSGVGSCSLSPEAIDRMNTNNPSVNAETQK